jgi:hypothetical protein
MVHCVTNDFICDATVQMCCFLQLCRRARFQVQFNLSWIVIYSQFFFKCWDILLWNKLTTHRFDKYDQSFFFEQSTTNRARSLCLSPCNTARSFCASLRERAQHAGMLDILCPIAMWSYRPRRLLRLSSLSSSPPSSLSPLPIPRLLGASRWRDIVSQTLDGQG